MYTVFFGDHYRDFNSEFEALYFIEEELHRDDWDEVEFGGKIMMYFVK